MKTQIIDERFYTPYEIHKFGLFKRQEATGKIIKYDYSRVYKIIRNDYADKNELKTRTTTNSTGSLTYYHTLGKNIKLYIKNNSHRYC